jgi:hypothetical protein
VIVAANRFDHPSLTLREATASALSGSSRARVLGPACDLVPTADLTLTIEETEIAVKQTATASS